MGNNVKKRFTVSLDIETKDLEKQVKSTVGNLKTILADLGNASDKMGYFKELVDYIGQVDAALTALRSKNKDAFDHMFDGLDTNLKKQLEDLFGTSGVDLGKLDVLREKLANLTPKSSIKELKQFAHEINDLFISIGAKAHFEDIDDQFKGRASAKHIEDLTDALNEFATVWDGVNKKIHGGFGLGGTGSGSVAGSGDVANLSAGVQKQIDELNRQVKELEEVKAKFEKVAKMVRTVQKKGDKAIPDSYKADLTVESVQKLMDEFDALKVKLESGDKASIDYYNNLTRMTEVVLTLKKAMSGIRADNSIKTMFVNTPSGKGDSMLGRLSQYAVNMSSGIFSQVMDLSKSKDIDSALGALFDRIEAIKTEAANGAKQSGNGSIINVDAIKNQIDELEKQANRLREIKLLFTDVENQMQELEAGEGLSESFEVDKTVKAVKELIAGYRALLDVHKQFVASGDTSSVDYYDNLSNLSKVSLQIQELDNTIGFDEEFQDILSGVKSGRGSLLDSLENAALDIGDFFEKTFINASQSVNKLIDDSQSKLQSLQIDLQKAQEQMKAQPKIAAGAKTANQVAGNDAGGSVGSGQGTGTGSGHAITDIDFTSLENTIKAEMASLANKLDNVLKVEVVKDNNIEIQSSIDGIKSSIDKISSYIDSYYASQGAAKNQAEINAMKGNLTQLLKFVSDFNARKVNNDYQHQELGAAILSDGSISVGYGEDGTVPWDRMASSLVANLSKSLLVDVHSHPLEEIFKNGLRTGTKYVNDFYSGSHGDIGAFRTSKDLGAKLAAMITGNIIRTLDISKLSNSQMIDLRDELEKIEKAYAKDPKYSKYMSYNNGKTSYHEQETLEGQHKITEIFESMMYKAFEKIGYSKDKVDQELFKKYNLTDDAQLTELAERLVLLSQSSQNALSPVERLSEIISQFSGNVNSPRAKVDLEAYQKGELTAAQVFNNLNGDGYTISQDTMDSLLRIDTASEISAVESLLSQITSVLEAINTGVSNIDASTRQSTTNKIDTAINDIVDISNGKIMPYLTSNIKSIFDPLNISEYKNQEVISQADTSIEDFQDSINSLFRDAAKGKLNIEDLNSTLNKFYTALSHVQDATKQVELYEDRTREEVEYNGEIASGYLDDRYSQLVDFDELQKLLYLLSQAKIDINKTKDFYKDGFRGAVNDDDNSALVGHLQAINATLDSIYGVLHGFTGIESSSKNSVTYKQPAVDAGVAQKEFTEQDLSVLNSILQAIQSIVGYLQAHDSNKTQENATKDNDDISELVNFIKSKMPQQLASDDTLQALKSIVDNLYNKLSQDDTQQAEPNDKNTEDKQESDVYQLLTSKLPQSVASEDTLQTLKGTLEQIAELLRIENGDSSFTESLNTLISTLTANVTALQEVASGIVQQQRAKKSDVSDAMARIADPAQHQQITDIASNSVGQLDTEVQIGNLKALADGVVKVEGAFKNASGEWEGFTVKINESNKAVDFAIDKQSAFAKSLNNTTTAQNDAAKALAKQVKTSSKDELTKLNGAFNTLNFKADDDLSGDAEKKNIADEYKQLSNILKQYGADASKVSQQELNDTLQRVDALHQEIKAYQKKHNLANGKGYNGNKTYGLNQLQNFTARYNSLMTGATDIGLSDQAPIVANLANAYQRLQAAQSAFVKGEDRESDAGKRKVAEFKAAQLACNDYARELKKVVDASKKLAAESDQGGGQSYTLADDFNDNIHGRSTALKEFVQTVYGSNATIGNFDKACNKLFFTIDNGDGTFTNMTASINDARTAIHSTVGVVEKKTTAFGRAISTLWSKFKSIGAYFTASFGWQEIMQQLRKGIQYVREIDSALTELKKVTNETDAAYDRFLQTMSKTAGRVGGTVADLTTMAAEWARLGYSMEEAGKLAESTAILLNVSEFSDATAASEALISTMQAFQYTANESQHVVDILNEVGNNFAVSSDGIATALQDSASALMEAGNNLEQSVALVAAANKVVQDPNSVGSALRTISLRLRGTSVKVLEEMGEETDGVVESISKMQEKIQALTGVDILTDSGAYKDTYTILKEIGTVWEGMSDIDQAALLELMAGKNRANTLAAILGNMEDLTGAYKTAIDAEGSALRENETYLESIQGHVDIFNNSLQTMWMNFLNTDAIKWFVHFGTVLVEAVDNIGLIETALMGVIGYLTIIKKQNWKDFFSFKDPSTSGGLNLLSGQELESAINGLNKALAQGPDVANQYISSQKELNNGIYQMTQQTNKATYTTGDYTQALRNLTPAQIQTAQKQNLLNVAIGLGMMAVTAIVGLIESYADSLETLEDSYNNLQSSISSLESELGSIESELSTIQEHIAELSNKNLTLTEAKELQRLKEQSAELERQKELQEGILKARESQNQAKSLAMINKMLGTTAANQEKAAEECKEWGSAIGTIAGILVGVLAVAAAPFTGGGSLFAGAGLAGSLAGAGGLALTTASIVGYAGGKLGASAGESLGSASKEAGGSLIEWYESYEKAIEEADREASEAEQKYFSDATDANYEKWQNKLNEVNTLQTDMYDGLEELREYIGNLEYNDATKDVIDGYNDLITHIDIKSNDGNIDAQISSIESLASEYYKLSKGVDENGKNVALSTEEYARYCDIVDQILAYTPGLIKGRDADGNAILGAADAQYTYNQLIAESIDLLKEQRRQAAEDAVSDKSLSEIINSVQKNYDSTIEGAANYDDLIWNDENQNLSRSVDIIGDVIGVEQDGWDDFWGINEAEYVLANAEKIAEYKDEILQAMADTGYYGGSELDNYSKWLDNLIQSGKLAAEKANAEIREQLYFAPQSSEYYDDLSGSQVAFINSYILGLEDLKDKSESEIREIRDNLVNLTNVIGENEGAQKFIDDLFALDPSKMPVQKYKDSINEVFAQLIDDNIITDEQKATIYNQLFPDMDDIDTMQKKVAAKLKTNSQGLVKNLTLPELRIAYKYLLEEADGSLSFEEMKQKIAEYSQELDGPIVETYSELSQQVTDFNDLLLQSSEIILDNTKVTQEYKDALIELGVSEEDLAECFDETNDLVVTNAKKLQDLTAKAGKNTAQNVRLAKSQARLQYYELFKKMQGYISAQGVVVKGKQKEILALYSEMNALEKVISKYETLEAQLLGTTNAYEKFQEAQTVDSETDYISKVEEMGLALGQAFNTAELGTESAQAAILGLVHPSVYEDLDTVDKKMAAIYDYFKSGKLAQYFDITWDDDGNIEGFEMKLGNLRKFIEDGLADGGANVFDGTDWQHFDFSDEFLAELEDLPDEADKLQYFADKMKVTKDVAFAFIKSLEDHDIEWLNGDYSTKFEDLIPDTLESDIFGAMEKIAELNAKLSSGEIDANEYKEQLKQLNKELVEAKEASRTNMFGEDGVNDKTPDEIDSMDVNNVDNYFDANQKVINASEDLEEATSQYEEAVKAVSKAQEEGREATEEEKKAIEDAEKAIDKAAKAYDEAIEKRDEFSEPTEAEIEIVLDDIESEIAAAGDKFDKALSENFDLDENGYYTIKAGLNMSDLESKYPGLTQYVNLLNSRTTLTAHANTSEAEVNLKTINDTLTNIQKILETAFNVKVETDGAITKVNSFKDAWDGIKSKTVTLWTKIFGGGEDNSNSKSSGKKPTRVNGSAHASGNWGLPQNEHDSLVGELGPEIVVDPHSGRYYTVGDNGAEMVDLPKGAIIFNHKQTEGLLKHGHVTSRGKAYAEGNAHLTIFDEGSSETQWKGTGYSSGDNPTWDAAEALSDAAADISDSASDAADEFREVFDWIEVRLEEINDYIDYKHAQLENIVGATKQNAKIDEIIDLNQKLYNNLTAGAAKYYSHADKLLAKVPEEYRKAAQDGTIAIETFVGEVDEKTLEAIQEYREWVQKGDDATKQAEETLTEISNLAKQAIENIAQDYDNKGSIPGGKHDQLDAYNELAEAKYGSESAEIYREKIRLNNEQGSILENKRNDMQAKLDEKVESGEIKKYSQAWYDAVNDIAAVDTEIINLQTDTEKYKDAITDIGWEHFDNEISRLQSVSKEADNLLDILSGKDMVNDDGSWTDDGITSLGLYAQKMEAAEAESLRYQEAINDLNANWQEMGYTEQEYLEKLDELKDGQYDAVKSYQDSKKAIVDLNKERIDAIKNGIDKEIDAYKELTDAKKEELDAEKDLHDFQKSVMDQQKDIADIERQLAALSGDNSASARAKRAQLEAELAEAKANLEETYYDRSINNQKEALDKEVENFEEAKEKEKEALDESLKDTERVVEDSYNKVQDNADDVSKTIASTTEKYGLDISKSITEPWNDGSNAIQNYSDQFGDGSSSTTNMLQDFVDEYNNLIDSTEDFGDKKIDQVEANFKKYQQAAYKEPKQEEQKNDKPKKEEKTIKVGGQINAGNAKIYDHVGAKAESQYYSKDPIYSVINIDGDWVQVRHKSQKSGVTGWFKKSDVKAYAKGSKGITEDQWALIDELGEELVLRAHNGKLTYLEKGTGIIPEDLTSNLMGWGKLDPSIMLDQNRPQIGVHPEIHNTQIQIDNSIAELIHIDKCDQSTLPDVEKIVNNALEKHTQRLNQSLRKYTR